MADRSVTVRLRAEIADFKRNLDAASARTRGLEKDLNAADASLGRVEKQASRTGSEIDNLSGRLRLVVDTGLLIGPALAPLGTGVLAGAVALTAQVGSLAGALGVTLLATTGLGDGLKALDAYQLDKTPENLAKMREEFAKLGPDGANFVRYLDSIEGELKSVQLTAREGLLPGFEEGIDQALTILPRLRSLVGDMSTEVGDLASDAGSAIADGDLDQFLTYLETDGIVILDDTARALGNLAVAAGNTLAAFAPVQTDWSQGLLNVTSDLADASAELEDNPGFRELVDYIQTTGPKVIDTLASIANAALQIGEAAAPLGGPALAGIKAVADVISLVADSDLGTPILGGLAALTAYNRALQITTKLQASAFGQGALAGAGTGAGGVLGRQFTETSTAAKSLRKDLAVLGPAYATVATRGERLAAATDSLRRNSGPLAAGFARAAGPAAALALSSSGIADGMGLANTATLGLAGSMAGPWGAAVGAGVGLLLDWSARSDAAKAAAADFTATLDAQTGALTENSRQKAISALNDSDALGAAKALGINLALVTDAALGNEQALAAVNGQLDKYLNADITGPDGGEMQAQATTAAALRDGLASVTGVVAAGRAAWESNAEAMGGSARQSNELKDAYIGATNAAATLTGQVDELNGVLDKRGAFRSYQASIDALKASLRDAPKAWSEFTDAGRTNLGNLDQIVADATRYLDELTSPKKKARFLDDVIGQLRTFAKTSPQAASAVREILPALKEVQSANKRLVITADNADAVKKAKIVELAARELNTMRPRPVISADAGGAMNIIANIRAALANLNGTTATTYVRTVRQEFTNPAARAGGGPIIGPGGPTEDRVPIMASAGEYMIQASAVRRYGMGLFEDLNAQRLAAGGRVGSGSPIGLQSTYVKRQPPDGYYEAGDGKGTGAYYENKAGDRTAAEVRKALRRLQAELDASVQSLEDERSARDAMIQASQAFAEEVGSAYAKADLFEGGLADFDLGLAANTNDTLAAQAALGSAQSRGLDGPLYEALAKSGNLQLLQQFGGLSAADIDARERSFATQSNAQAAFGGEAANNVFAESIRAQSVVVDDQGKAVKELRGQVKHLEQVLNNMEKAVERGAKKGAEDGTKAGNNGRDGRVSSQTRTQPRPQVRAGGGRR